MDGWLIAKAGLAHGMPTLVSINPRTGAQHPLWPDAQELRLPTLTASATGFNSPALALPTQQLAFVATDLSGQRSIWIGPLGIGADGWPGFTSPPHPILNLCGGCNDIASWSPSGQWLIFKAPQGLMAFAPTTGEMRAVTDSARDAWPACAPNGQWLAYQGAWGGVVVLPAQDCLPRYPHLQHAHMVHGISLGWHPTWSLDSQTLAFESNDVPDQLLYEVAINAVGEGLSSANSDPVRTIGDGQCNYLIWATRLRHQSAVILLVCHPPPPSPDLGTIAIMPDAPMLAWRAIIHGGFLAWDHLCWLPPAAVQASHETSPLPLT